MMRNDEVRIGDEDVNAVNARGLHAALGVGRDFSNWIKDQIARARLIEHRDFERLTENGEQCFQGVTSRIEYALSLDAAKHIAMMAGTDKGKQASYLLTNAKVPLVNPGIHIKTGNACSTPSNLVLRGRRGTIPERFSSGIPQQFPRSFELDFLISWMKPKATPNDRGHADLKRILAQGISGAKTARFGSFPKVSDHPAQKNKKPFICAGTCLHSQRPQSRIQPTSVCRLPRPWRNHGIHQLSAPVLC